MTDEQRAPLDISLEEAIYLAAAIKNTLETTLTTAEQRDRLGVLRGRLHELGRALHAGRIQTSGGSE